MLFVSFSTPDIPQPIPNQIDGIELRLDLLPHFDLELVSRFLQASPRPVMLTLRKAAQGGKFRGTEEAREKGIEQLLALAPPFFDLEADMRPAFLETTLKKHPKTRFILSHHDFKETPHHLEEIYRSMSRYSPFNCKIAAMAHSTNDALRMLLFVRSHPRTSAICMGEKGEFARVLGKTVGNVIEYANLDGQPQTGPGQLTLQDLVSIYHYPSLNINTAIYGLIGDPVAKSPGHIHHNDIFRKRHVNGVYVKMIVKPEELEAFIPLAKELGIRGLSVTIPLKEKILPFIDEIDPKAKQIGAVNTLRFDKGRIYGTNTDGFGALDAIEKQLKVHGKKIVILAAGGAARGIAFEAHWRGGHVTILNRTVERAEEIAQSVGGKAGSPQDVPADYDVLINCSPDPMPIDPAKILSKALVMDVVYAPRETAFLKEALRRGCKVVYGEEMFLNQAAGQTAYWLG